MIRYVGIDLHKHLLVAHMLDEQGNTVATAKCEGVTAQSLKRFAKRHLQPGDQLALEVTTHVWAVVRFLLPFVSRIVVSNPMATKAIASAKVKTDKVDAVKLLMTLPGVSYNTAATILAAIGDIERFSAPEKLASYFGLTPSTHQSAGKCYHGKITKAGNVLARTALIQAAHSAARDAGPLGHFFAKTRRRKNYNVAITATARKLAMLCWQLLSTGTPYRYAKPSSVEAKLSKLRVAGSGAKRKGGMGPGIDARVARPASEQHQRRTGSLAEVLAKEQVAQPDGLKPGERKMLESIGQLEYYESLQRASVRRKSRRGRSGRQQPAEPATPSAAASAS